MQVQDEFLDLKLKLENIKIAVDVFAKPTKVSHMCYLLVVNLEKVSIIYHVV